MFVSSKYIGLTPALSEYGAERVLWREQEIQYALDSTAAAPSGRVALRIGVAAIPQPLTLSEIDPLFAHKPDPPERVE